MKEKVFSKILEKSNQFQFYKEQYEVLDKKNQILKDNNQRLREKNQLLRESKKKLRDQRQNLMKKLSFFNFDEFLCNSYISPVIKLPFSNEDKQCFAFMDYLSEFLTEIALKDKKHLVSIIMPTYNRKDRVLIAIDSVLNQSYDNFELIIIDDASDDGTIDVLNSLDDSRIKIISHNENKGVSAARNSGLKISKGEYVAYLDSDNDWDVNYLSSMVGAFLLLSDADALYSGQILYSEFNSEPFAVRFGAYNKMLLHNRNYIDLNCFCHKLDVYKKVGGFDESLLRFVDWDLTLRISNKLKIYSVPVLLSNYYHHSADSRVSFVYDDVDVTYDDCVSEILEKTVYDYPIEKSLKRKVSVIIINFESLNELKNCVESIFLFNKDMVDIIIVDNNSNEGVVNYLKELDVRNNVKIIFNEDNYSFSHCINQGINSTDETSDILLLNNDAILTDGAISNMQKFAYDNEECGIVVPHKMLYGDDPEIKLHVPYANRSFECDVIPSKFCHNIINVPIFQDDSLLELNFAPFFCIYIKREVYNDTYGFDFELGGYGSDRVFSDYVRSILKRRIYQCPFSFVYHKPNVDLNFYEEHNIELGFNKKLLNSGSVVLPKRLWDI